MQNSNQYSGDFWNALVVDSAIHQDKDDPGFWVESGPSAIGFGMYDKKVMGTVSRCVGVLAGTLTGLPRKVMSGDTEIMGRPINALLENPSPLMASESFWDAMFRDFVIHGNAYAQIKRMNDGPESVPVQLRHIPEHRVQPDMPFQFQGDRRIYPRYTITEKSGRRHNVREWNMLVLHGPGFNVDLGKSPSRVDTAAYVAIDIQRKIARYVSGGMKRGFFGKMFAKAIGNPETAWTDDQIKAYAESLKKSLIDNVDFDKVGMLRPGVDLDVVKASSPQEMMLDKMLEWTTLEICQALEVPPRLAYFYKTGTRPSVGKPEADEHAFMKSPIAPLARLIKAELTRKLLSPDEKRTGVRIDLFIDDLAQGTLSERAAIADQLASKAGIIKINEGRKIVGHPPLPPEQGDRLLPSKGAPAEGQAMTREDVRAEFEALFSDKLETLEEFSANGHD